MMSDVGDDILGVHTKMLGCSEPIALDEVDQNYSRPHNCISGETLANLMRQKKD
jgi:hypothetical protein